MFIGRKGRHTHVLVQFAHSYTGTLSIADAYFKDLTDEDR